MNSLTTAQALHAGHYRALETARLLLRPLSMEDADAMFSYTSRPESFQFLRGEAHQSVRETLAFLQKAVEAYAAHGDFLWGICTAGNGCLVGTCRLFDLHMTDLRGEVSYLVHPDMHGLGIASEAVAALIRFAFFELQFVRVQARCAVENTASERVMQKCGMQYEGTLRSYARIHGVWKDYKLYSAIKENS